MISNIVPGRYINAIPSTSYLNAYGSTTSTTNRFIGEVMFDHTTQKLKVFTGTDWVLYDGGSTFLSLTDEATSLLDYVAKKRSEDLELERLAEEHPSIRDLLDQINEKKQQIEVIKNLVKKEEVLHIPV